MNVPYTPTALRFSRNAKLLAVAAGNGTPVRFLNPETLELVSTFAAGSGDEFEVSQDGKIIAAFTSINTLTVSESDTGLPRLEIPVEGSKGLHFALLPDGKSIALADRSGRVTLYKVAGGKPFLTFDHGMPIDGMAPSADGKRLATGGAGPEPTIKIWEIDDARAVKHPRPVAVLPGVSEPSAWFGADRIAAAGPDGVGIYDIKQKRWVGVVAGVTGRWAVSPDEKYVAAASAATLRIRVWELATGRQLHAQNDNFRDIALLTPTPDGESIFLLAAEGAQLWSFRDQTIVSRGKPPSPAITAATGGGRLAVATSQGVFIYDEFDPAKGLTGKPNRRLEEFAAGPRSIAVSPDGRRVAYSGETERIVIADAATGKTIRIVPGKTIALGLAFSPDGRKLAVAGRDAFLRLWPIDEARDENSDLWRVRLQRAPRAGVAFNRDGTMMAATSATMIKVVDPGTGEVLAQLDRRDVEDGVFQQVQFSPDSRLLVTGSAGVTGAVCVYELETRTLVRRFTTSLGSIHRLAMFPDGSRAASAGMEETVTLWNLTGRWGKPAPSRKELAAAWADLDSLEGARGEPAIRTIIAGGAEGARTVAAGIDAMIANQKEIAAMVRSLSAKAAIDREAAKKSLLEGGYPALVALEATARTMSEELRNRANELIKQLASRGLTMPAHGLVGDNLRLLRAVHALEAIGGRDSRTQIERIAVLAGRHDRAQSVARAALGRMRQE